MARSTIVHTRPGTVAHGYIIVDGRAEWASFEFEGAYYSPLTAEKRVRAEHNPTFSIDSVTHYRKVYEMGVDEFVERARLVDISEKES